MNDRDAVSFRARLRRAVDASATVRTCGRLVRGSILCRGLVVLARSVSPASSYVWSRVRPVTPPGDFPRAIRILADSRMCTFVEGFCRGMLRAWGESAVRRIAVGSLPPLESWQRVRLVGWAVLVSTIVRMVLRPPAWPSNPLQLSGWVLPTLLGIVLMWGARPIAAAWADRRRRSVRLARR